MLIRKAELAALLVVVACAAKPAPPQPPRGYASTTDIAMGAPCRFLGTSHRDSRSRIERLRSCGAVTHAQWACMAEAASAVDEEFTARCRTEAISHAAIASRQRSSYQACMPSTIEIAEWAVFSSDAAFPGWQCEPPEELRPTSNDGFVD